MKDKERLFDDPFYDLAEALDAIATVELRPWDLLPFLGFLGFLFFLIWKGV